MIQTLSFITLNLYSSKNVEIKTSFYQKKCLKQKRIIQFFVIHMQKMAFNGSKKYKPNSQYSFVLFRYMGKASNIFDYELKH